MEYDHASFDWDYVEKRSSSKLRAIMTEKKVVPLSQFPSVAGVSKLQMCFARNFRQRH